MKFTKNTVLDILALAATQPASSVWALDDSPRGVVVEEGRRGLRGTTATNSSQQQQQQQQQQQHRGLLGTPLTDYGYGTLSFDYDIPTAAEAKPLFDEKTLEIMNKVADISLSVINAAAADLPIGGGFAQLMIGEVQSGLSPSDNSESLFDQVETIVTDRITEYHEWHMGKEMDIFKKDLQKYYSDPNYQGAYDNAVKAGGDVAIYLTLSKEDMEDVRREKGEGGYATQLDLNCRLLELALPFTALHLSFLKDGMDYGHTFIELTSKTQRNLEKEVSRYALQYKDYFEYILPQCKEWRRTKTFTSEKSTNSIPGPYGSSWNWMTASIADTLDVYQTTELSAMYSSCPFCDERIQEVRRDLNREADKRIINEHVENYESHLKKLLEPAWRFEELARKPQVLCGRGEVYDTTKEQCVKPQCASGTVIRAGDSFAPNNRIYSENGDYFMNLELAGNLAVNKASPFKTLWHAGITGKQGNRFFFQGDGNLVVRNPDKAAVWSSHTAGTGATHGVMGNDGRVVLYDALCNAVWATDLPSSVEPEPKQCFSGTTVLAGDTFDVNTRIYSENRDFFMNLESAGNLAVNKVSPFKTLWHAGITGKGGNQWALQGDGNLVVRNPEGKAVWASGTAGYDGVQGVMRDDGRFFLYDKDCNVVWATERTNFLNPVFKQCYPGTLIHRGDEFDTDTPIFSENENHLMNLQRDGNLVVSRRGSKDQELNTWHAGINGKGGNHLALQGDGNLVVRNPDKSAVWSSGTSQYEGVHGVMRNDGLFFLYDEFCNVIWATTSKATGESTVFESY